MKFVCVTCDAQMKNVNTERQASLGTLSVVLECPQCFGQVGMLTNQWETSLLDSLDVSVCPVGGKGRAAATAANLSADPGAAPAAAGSESPVGSAWPAESPSPALAPSAAGAPEGPAWSAAAEARLAAVPGFAREWARRGVESYARDRGIGEITPEVVERAHAGVGPAT